MADRQIVAVTITGFTKRHTAATGGAKKRQSIKSSKFYVYALDVKYGDGRVVQIWRR